MKKRKIIISAVSSLLLAGLMTAGFVASAIAEPILTVWMGTLGATPAGGTEYSAYKTDEQLQNARVQAGRDVMGEGAVLLKNDKQALPLTKTAKVSIFGQHAHEILASGAGSGSIGDPDKSLKEVSEASGMSVNSTLWNYYLNNGGKSLGKGPALAGGNSVTDWSINETAVSSYPSEVTSSYAAYNDAAIVVISRTGGEGGDIAKDMVSYGGKAGESYLELSQEEKDLLQTVKASFGKTIVLLNTNNPIELGFLKDYDISACLYIGGVGMSGLNELGDLLTGVRNPSGHLADTYSYDAFSAPATANFGDFHYSDNAAYSYVSYNEGIYVGYRYYETRYADGVMGAKQVGTYDYDSVVAYPFGYGGSYTTFAWDSFSLQYDNASDSFTAKVTVKNTGKSAGKDVVELYASAPYVHDVTTIEKSAVTLVGFAKTSTLAAGASEEVKISVDKRQLASYDPKGAKTYILENGDYYFTAAQDAHEATNNILAKQGFNVTGTGLVDKYHQSSDDVTSYSKDSSTGKSVTNLFDYAEYSGMNLLSRNNWSVLEQGIKVNNLPMPESAKEAIALSGKEASHNPNLSKSVPAVTTASSGTAQLKDMVKADFDDAKWQSLVQQIKKSDLQKLFATAGYKTNGIDYIGKPATKDSDGPGGLQSFVGGASSVKAYGYPSESLLACSWSVDTAKELGAIIGEDGIHGGVSGWYAPGMNTHRSPFGGRNFEYYSEDGFLGGKMGAKENAGAAEKGLYAYIKHFALNEQDTNRGVTLHTWASEQAMREIYFKPFETSIKEGKAAALMTSLACLGPIACAGNYDLITSLLKEEWGFKGFAITDYLAFSESLMMQVLFAGGDAMLTTYGVFSDKSDATMAELQRAAKRILYTVSRSNAMYGVLGGASVNSGYPIYKIYLIAAECFLGLALVGVNLIVWLPRKKKNTKQDEAKISTEK